MDGYPAVWTEEELSKLFDSQIEILRERGCPTLITDNFQYHQKDWVLRDASKMQFTAGHLPFLPIIPRAHRELHDLMAMIRFGTLSGMSSLDPPDIEDNEIVRPYLPYYIFDVSNGSGIVQENGECLSLAEGRRHLFIAEVIALCILTSILSIDSRILAMQSVVPPHGSSGGVAMIEIHKLFSDNSGKPELVYHALYSLDKNDLIPSCNVKCKK